MLTIIVTMTAGTAMIMWLGELITQRGIGNGMSLIIFVSIVSQLPSQFGILWTNSETYEFVIVSVVMLALTVGIIFMDQGQRRIPIQFSRRVRGRKVLGGQSTYIPLKVNMAGVIPVIFATSIMYFPVLISSSLPSTGWGASVRDWINDNLLSSGAGGLSPTLPYILMLGLLVVFFTYFYTAIQFDPERQAETIQRQGGFIPGIRPGRATVKHLEHILNRITLAGVALPGACCRAAFVHWLPIWYSGWLERCLDSDRVWRCPRDDEADREPADDAQLRGLPLLARTKGLWRRRTEYVPLCDARIGAGLESLGLREAIH